jgi:hypothetical protein
MLLALLVLAALARICRSSHCLLNEWPGSRGPPEDGNAPVVLTLKRALLLRVSAQLSIQLLSLMAQFSVSGA